VLVFFLGVSGGYDQRDGLNRLEPTIKETPCGRSVSMRKMKNGLVFETGLVY
jgi:hypothetical protein